MLHLWLVWQLDREKDMFEKITPTKTLYKLSGLLALVSLPFGIYMFYASCLMFSFSLDTIIHYLWASFLLLIFLILLFIASLKSIYVVLYLSPITLWLSLQSQGGLIWQVMTQQTVTFWQYMTYSILVLSAMLLLFLAWILRIIYIRKNGLHKRRKHPDSNH